MEDRKQGTGDSKPVNATAQPICRFSVSCFRFPVFHSPRLRRDRDGRSACAAPVVRHAEVGECPPVSAPGTEPPRRPTRRRCDAGDEVIRAERDPPPPSGRSAWKPIPPPAAFWSDAARSCAGQAAQREADGRRITKSYFQSLTLNWRFFSDRPPEIGDSDWQPEADKTTKSAKSQRSATA